jgi:hypothetical protein
MKSDQAAGTDTASLLKSLAAEARSIEKVSVPAEAGVYAWFAKDATTLPHVSVSPGEPIYIGSSTNLAQRQYETHFSPRSTGFSTIRRTLGALLKQDLRLTARPRGLGKTPQDFYCYRFDPDSEERLTGWMREHILVSAHPTREYNVLEGLLMMAALPILNLKGVENSEAREIKRLRKACADEARAKRNLTS